MVFAACSGPGKNAYVPTATLPIQSSAHKAAPSQHGAMNLTSSAGVNSNQSATASTITSNTKPNMVTAGNGGCNTVLCGGGGCLMAGPVSGKGASDVASSTKMHTADCGGGQVWVPGGCGSDVGGTNCTPGSWQTAPGGGNAGGCSICTPVGGGGRGGGIPVAVRPPAIGDTCHDSGSALGDNLPATSRSTTTEITNIYALWATNQTGNVDVVGWVYTTPTSTWVQARPGFQDFWSNIAQSIPGIGAFGSAFQNGGYAQAGSSLWNSLNSYLNAHDGTADSCFTRNLG